MSPPDTARQAWAIGLTGGIACGKSEIARMLEAEGAVVRDADDVAHEVIRSGGALFRTVVDRFGRDILGADGEIDRGRLGRKVFADPAERKALEAIIHPAVIRELDAWVAETKRLGKTAVAVIPLLYEAGLADRWDAVICVTAPDAAVLSRLAQRGLTEKEARARIAAQMPVDEKAKRADYVVKNEGTLDAARKQIRTIWMQMWEKKGSHHGRT